MCSLAAAVQGMDETVNNGAQAIYFAEDVRSLSRKFVLTRLIKDLATQHHFQKHPRSCGWRPIPSLRNYWLLAY